MNPNATRIASVAVVAAGAAVAAGVAVAVGAAAGAVVAGDVVAAGTGTCSLHFVGAGQLQKMTCLGGCALTLRLTSQLCQLHAPLNYRNQQ